VALGVDTGKSLWATLVGTIKGGTAPNSTPTVDNEWVFVLSSDLRLSCLNTQKGLLICAGYLPSQQSNLPPITTALFPNQRTNQLFKCPVDNRIFPTELTSYEWNFWLNDAPYSEPQWAPIYTNEALVIVNRLFGGRNETPIIGDAEPLHKPGGAWMGKNALCFDGRVQRARLP